MNIEKLNKIKEAINLLSQERVNTAGLGAPINILKALVEDSEQQSEDKPATVPNAEGIAQFVIDNRYKSVLNNLSDFELFHTISSKIDSYAELKVQEAVKDNEENKHFALELSSIIATSKSIEEAKQRYKEVYLKRFGNGNTNTKAQV